MKRKFPRVPVPRPTRPHKDKRRAERARRVKVKAEEP
jgi:hypothetical protein